MLNFLPDTQRRSTLVAPIKGTSLTFEGRYSLSQPKMGSAASFGVKPGPLDGLRTDTRYEVASDPRLMGEIEELYLARMRISRVPPVLSTTEVPDRGIPDSLNSKYSPSGRSRG